MPSFALHISDCISSSVLDNTLQASQLSMVNRRDKLLGVAGPRDYFKIPLESGQKIIYDSEK